MCSSPIQPVPGVPGAPSGTSDTPRAALAPTPDHVSRELNTDFGDIQKQKVLTSNWKMKLGIALGVLVGIVVLAIVLGAVIASHGALGAVLGIVAIKLSLGAKVAAHAMHVGSIGAKAISAVATAIVFLGGGTIAGKLFNKGEQEALETLIPESLKKFKEFEKSLKITVTESEIEEHLTKTQATVLSVQSGRNFVQAGRRAKLHYAPSAYEGFSGIVKKVVKAFGHFWGVVASTTMKSLFDGKQYALYNSNHFHEKSLKIQSADGVADKLTELNVLRSTQIEQYVGKLDALGVAYAKAPELLAYDRIIAKLEILKSKLPSEFAQIDPKILEAKEKKLELIKKRLTPNELGSISGNSGPVKSLLTISEDIMKLPELTEEAKGQILEAVSILLRQNSECTINHVNRLILILVENSNLLVANDRFSTREHTIKYAEKFAEAYRSGSLAPPFIDTSSSDSPATILAQISTRNLSPMSTISGHHLLLRTLDVAISAIHAMPITGSSALAASLTAYAVTKEKGGSFIKVTRKVGSAVAGAFAEIRKLPGVLGR